MRPSRPPTSMRRESICTALQSMIARVFAMPMVSFSSSRRRRAPSGHRACRIDVAPGLMHDPRGVRFGLMGGKRGYVP